MQITSATAYPAQAPFRPPASRLPATALPAAAAPPSFPTLPFSLWRLWRTWGALGSLFGGTAAPPSFAALSQTIQASQQRLAEAQQRQAVITTLKSSALRGAEELIAQAYGLSGDGAPLEIILDDTLGDALSSLSYELDDTGRATDEEMHVNFSQFRPDAGPNGTNAHVIENDRIIAHELTHAVMGRTMAFGDLPDWFQEGTAEYISGGLERTAIALQHYSPAQLINRVRQPWAGDTTQYASAYVAVRFLDAQTAPDGGLRAIMQRLHAGDTLDEAIATVSQGRWSETGAFLATATGAEGLKFLQSLDTSGRTPGSIKPGAGPAIVSDERRLSEQPLRGFRIQWPSPVNWLLPAWGPAAYGLQTATHTLVQTGAFLDRRL